MDTAGAEHADTPKRPGGDGAATGAEPPSIGVPSIPPAADRANPPAPVPSVPVPEPDPAAPVQLTPVREPPTPPQAAAPPQEAAPPPAPAEPPEETPPSPEPTGDGLQAFPAGVAERLRAYVYLLIDPRTGRPFYVGRGRGDRCFDHVRRARLPADARPAPEEAEPDLPVLDRIRQAESTGREVRVDILAYGLKGSEASLVERAARESLGFRLPAGAPGQRRPATEVAAHLAKRAKFKRPHQVVLLRVGGKGADPSYEVARHNWRIGRRWIDPGSPRAPRWAVVVVGDLVAGIHRIERWETDRESGGAGARPTDRYSFVGAVDPELESRYLGRSVAGYFGAGAPAPVTYVWCGPHWVNTPA